MDTRRFVEDGGAGRVRTDDPLLAKQVRSQLSYSPIYFASLEMVGLGRFELPTSPLSGVRSNQLSYRPECHAMCKRAKRAYSKVLNPVKALNLST